ncbi:MAG: hypothetical protein ACRDMI_03985 [Streptosporangiaceae bacterium]
MTQMIEVYRSASSATPAPSAEPALGLEQRFAWMAVSSSETPDQAWFWTPEWQEGEREADEHIAARRTEYFDSVEEFLAALDGDAG